MILSKVMCIAKSPYQMSKSTKKTIQYMYIFLLFFGGGGGGKLRQSLCELDSLKENNMFSSIYLFYEQAIYFSKWIETVQMYGEKVVARSNPEGGGGGGSTPHHTIRSWQVCAHMIYIVNPTRF